MIEIDPTLPAELGPLQWLIGDWEGTGVVAWQHGDTTVNYEFGQRVSFAHHGLAYLSYQSYSWRLDDELSPIASESGYWRIARPATSNDAGPGMLVADEAAPFQTAEAVETLRRPDGAFDIEASIVHPTGVSELYLGVVDGPRIDLATDAVMRAPGAKEHSASTRMYGLVEGHLLWAWDLAALDEPMRSHASARLGRTDRSDRSAT
ncbi:FABP family protein [Humidisolicoccus flavus]|uniref:FABP family protein n=1 Tax=Humidisolicoccus flavus TaxID=3111414 RepID=UPI0032483F40